MTKMELNDLKTQNLLIFIIICLNTNELLPKYYKTYFFLKNFITIWTLVLFITIKKMISVSKIHKNFYLFNIEEL
jgi:hypothetical protein